MTWKKKKQLRSLYKINVVMLDHLFCLGKGLKRAGNGNLSGNVTMLNGAQILKFKKKV
jgi:hypothetical protein